jgi:Arc/MetJ-type ribon-helix-helix transcriptional regulator
MKKKVSISVDESTLSSVEAMLESGLFRNKSHFIEYAVKRLLNGGND